VVVVVDDVTEVVVGALGVVGSVPDADSAVVDVVAGPVESTANVASDVSLVVEPSTAESVVDVVHSKALLSEMRSD
jgi:hypothetical protein